MKKYVVLTLVLALTLALSSCFTPANQTQLGDTAYSIVLPEGYVSGEDEFAEDQIAYFYKDDESVDFDVYQWEKGEDFTLESEANHYAAEYGTTAEPVTVNGISGWKYVSVEDYEGLSYTVVNYMFEDDTYILEICFWTIDTEAEYEVVDGILKTLKKS